MKKQICEKSYGVSDGTRRILDCKIMNDELYSSIYEIVNELDPAGAEQIMSGEVFNLYSRIDDILNKYLGESVSLNFGDLKNLAKPQILI